MSERTLYYWAREYVDGIKEGEDYNELPRVITINIVNFDHIKLDKFHTTFRLREDDYKDFILTRDLELHFLNMVQFRRLMRLLRKEGKEMSMTSLEKWMTFFDENTSIEELAELIKTDSAISKAHSRLLEVTRDEEIMQNYRMRQKALSDWTTGINTAIEKGLKKGLRKGRIEGITEGRMENARLMKADGVPFEQIARWTNIPLEIIKTL